MDEKLIVYGHPTCPMMPATLGVLKASKVDYQYINIHQDFHARERVREINHGYESVPTLVFPDGRTLTEPSTGELSKELEAEGYTVPWQARLLGQWQWIVIGIGVTLALLRALGVF